MRLMNSGVRRATDDDAEGLSALVADALLTSRLSAWLVSDPIERPRVVRRYAQLVVAQGLAQGMVDTTDDLAGVAVWYSRLVPPPPSAAWMYDLHRMLGVHAARFGLLHAYVDAVHPYTAHHYLAHLAVTPGRRQTGVGAALLARHHRLLDAEQLPSYAEVSTDRPREGLLAGLGYEPRSPILLQPGGPALWRMWRQPVRPGQPDEAGGDGLPRRVRVQRTAMPFRGAVRLAAAPRSP
ncbi:hypothetical protein Van01_53770 [Micromonospora andamanensis]|uniref:N-acetyltransferase n=2 Tax=Micromonospora andamanensis TaxID=1287068 RepID=A0ABQ4I2M8_9ACTN|nr:hypothetical protein Van01_53770 [Micromonospora andamanensis]